VHFRVWAPALESLAVVIDGNELPLEPDGNGYFAGVVEGTGAGTLYRFGSYPDPASRFQPEGPHGPSMVVDPAYEWRHDSVDVRAPPCRDHRRRLQSLRARWLLPLAVLENVLNEEVCERLGGGDQLRRRRLGRRARIRERERRVLDRRVPPRRPSPRRHAVDRRRQRRARDRPNPPARAR